MSKSDIPGNTRLLASSHLYTEMSERRRDKLKAMFSGLSSKIGPGSAIYSGLRTSLTLLKEIADVSELPGLGGAVGGLLKVVEIIEKMAQNQDDAIELLDYLKGLEQMMNDTQNSKIPEALASRIEELSQEIIKIVHDIEIMKSRRTMIKFIKNDADATVLSRHVQAINRLFFKFQLGSSVVLEKQMMLVTGNVTDIKQDFKVVTGNVTNIGQDVKVLTANVTKIRQDVKHLVQADNPHTKYRPFAPHTFGLELPRVVEARFDMDNRHRCLEGTRVELLDTVRRWAQEYNSGDLEMRASIFWLCGQAGTGKTTICSSVADSCHAQGRLGASFFFSRDREDRNNIRLVLPTIAHQLGTFCKDFEALVTEVFRSDPDVIYSDPLSQLERLIIDPLKACPSFPPGTVIVIDALDECKDEEPISTLLTMLSDNRSRISQLKFFISSRPEENIHLGFEPLQEVTQSLILHDVDASIVDADIELYLRKGLATASRIYRHIVGRDWPPDDVIKSLVKKSSRLFIFASTAVKFILDRNYSDPIQQLNVLEESQGMESSSSPFRYLDQLYLKVLQQAFPESTPLDHFALVKMLLGVIVVLRNPLSPGDLENMLKLRRGVIRTTLRHLHSIMVVPDTDEHPIRLIHPSFFDFATERCPDPKFRVKLSLCHEQLATLCFDQMKRLKRDICEVKDASKLNEEIEDLPERIERHIPPALRYACHNWVFHVCGAGESASLQASLDEFCHGRLLYWIEVLGLVGSLQDGIRHIQALRKHLTNYSYIAKELVMIFKDILVFIPEYFELISSASLQLYRSALPLSSPNSLQKAFAHELHSGIRVLQRAGEGNHSGVIILRGHAMSVLSIGFSPDGTLILSVSCDDVRVWDRDTGTPSKSFIIDPSVPLPIVWAKFLPGGERIISGSENASICIWDVTRGACLKTIKLEGEYGIRHYACSPDFTRVIGSTEKDILLWDISNGSCLKILSGHNEDIRSITFSPNQMLIASAADDSTIRLWDAASGATLNTLSGHSKPVMAVAFSPCSEHIVSGSKDGDARLWDTSRGITSKIFNVGPGGVCSVAFSRDGKQIITGSGNGQLQVWDVGESKLLNTWSVGYRGAANHVGFSLDRSHYICTVNRNIYIWDANQASDLDRSEGQLHDIKFSPDSTYIIGRISEGCDVYLWDGLTGGLLQALKGHSDSISALSFSPNNQYIASGSRDNTIRLWATSNRKALRTFEGHSGQIFSVAFSSDNTQIVSTQASTSEDGTVRIWDVTSGNNIFTVEANYRRAWFSPDGSQIIIDNLYQSNNYDIPAHLRSQPVPLNTPDPGQLRYRSVIKEGWIFAYRGDKKERCAWVPVEWIWFPYSDISSTGRVAIGTRYGLVLLDLSDIKLSI